MNNDRMNLDEIEELTLEQLYSLLGRELFQKGRDFGPIGIDGSVELARHWFESKLNQWMAAICADERVVSAIDGPKKDLIAIVAAVLEEVGDLVDGQLPIVVSALIATHGIGYLCSKFASE